MSNTKSSFSNEQIETFLQGSDPQKYIVAIEAEYNTPNVTLVVNDPETGKRLEEHKYKPFLWFKEDVTKIMYEGKRMKIIEACAQFDVKITKLKTSNDEGYSPSRMENGYKYMATCKKSYNDLINFFKRGGIDLFSKENTKLFVMFSPSEQFLIQTGKRLFKGMDDYNDIHRLQFDLETEGLFASKNAIFQIGVKDNKGVEGVLETLGDTPAERRKSERENIEKFFKIIEIVKPDVIAGYNSENFDWPFLFERAERLSIPITELAITLNRISKIKRKPSTLKLGGETESYNQTHMYGYNIIDISHAVRRAMAINSEIKGWGLKYITQYSGIAKPNRVYVPGDKINSTWADKVNDYAFNEKNGDWYKITAKNVLKEGYKIVKGDYIVQRYLIDDLWETEQIDNLYNQASFLIAKILPTNFMRSSTMGTAGQWKLIMSAWSYEHGLAIPETQTKRDFTGGLSRLLEVGYARNVYKLDYAALYPKTQLTHDIFPDLDISGVMKGILTYVVDTRDKFKFLTGIEKKKAKKLQAKLDAEMANMSQDEIEKMKAQIAEHKRLSNLYDKKQLPLKILANSWFGSYGAPYIFNWGDTDSAEETTCRGRQYLRLMVRHFTEKHGFRALVGDSVTYDTPVYIRYKSQKNYIDVLPICDLFNKNSEFLDADKFRDFEEKPFEVLTRNGWKDIKYVYRHETDKKIHRITTKDRLINVTEDHSLFQNGKEIKPSELKRFDEIDTYEIPKNNVGTGLNVNKAYLCGFFLGDGSANCSTRIQKYKSKKTGEIHINKGKRSDWKISNSRIGLLEKLQIILKDEYSIDSVIKNHIKSSGVYNLVVYNVDFANNFCEHFYTSYREKKIPYMILNATEDIKKSFIEGVFVSDGYGDTIEDCSDIGMKSQVAMAGISLLLKELNIEYKIKTRSDNQNFISFSLKNNNRNNSSFTELTKKKTNEVWKNEIILNKDKNNFVYDISTEDGTFICGINGIIAHNTDGFNFAAPNNLNEIKYVAKGTHWKTIDDKDKELVGIEAVLADFNEHYMEGRMGLDLDDVCNSTINFARKNYANDIGGKIKLVGNSVKSKKMSVYIEEFLGKGIRMLLDGDGKSFVNFYYEYVDKIYNYQIPLVKMASKAKIKTTISEYKKKATMKNKAGNPLPKQAHMELAIKEGLDITLGDVLYYINTGSSKSTGDLKTINKSKMKKKEMERYVAVHGHEPKSEVSIQLNCKLIDPKFVERDFEAIKEMDMLKKAIMVEGLDDESKKEMNDRIEEINANLVTDEYNVARYLDSFNKKVKPLLVCFNPEIRDRILLDIVKIKDKQTKTVTEKLKERTIFTSSECELVSGMPRKEADQDSYEELMKMEDKEIKFWDRVNKVPNNMEVDEWNALRADYHERMIRMREEGIVNEKEELDKIFKRLEVSDYSNLINKGVLPTIVFIIVDVQSDDSGVIFVSRKWNETLCRFDDVFKYEKEAIQRDLFYKEEGIEDKEDRYDKWLEKLMHDNVMVNNIDINQDETYVDKDAKTEELITLLQEQANNVPVTNEVEKKKRVFSEGGEDDDDGELEEDEDGNLIREEEKLILDDEVDDTYGEKPEDYKPLEVITKEEEKEDDGWLF